MKPYLVDVPVRIQIWIRPDCQRKQFDIVKKARPSILFLISDGGRNEKECKLIAENRKMIEENIDWECQVYKLYEEKNLGLYTIGKKSNKLIWSIVDRCIMLEDDILPAVSFFRYCAELLEKYKYDERINVICGMNHLGVCENVNSDYFFSRQGSIWGIARWRRSYDRYYDFDYGKDSYIMSLLHNQTSDNKIFWKRLKAYSKQKYYEGHVAGGEFFIEFGMYGQNQLQIIPKKNLISNIGCTAESTHAAELKNLPKGIRRIFNMNTYELEFPLKHAKYVIPDVNYEKKRNRIMAYNRPVINFYRKCETAFLRFFRGNKKEVVLKISNVMRGKQDFER